MVDMEQQRYCNLEDMVQFLLALCCCNDSSTIPASPDEILETLFNDCLRSVAPIASSDELKERLVSYKSSSSTHEWGMDLLFAEAMNYSLERLSAIEVDGLPQFKSHIAFVPCIRSYREESSSTPDVAIVSIEDAYKFYRLDGSNAPELSKFVSEISKKSPSGLNWKAVLSAIEINGRKDVGQDMLRASKWRECAAQGIDEFLDEEWVVPQPETSTSSTIFISSKRSASAAGMDADPGTSSSKRPRVAKKAARKAPRTLVDQNDIYSTDKFSDSVSISHVLNLLIENDCLWVSWIDREGQILSSGCSFFEELSLTLALLLILQRFGRRQWGYVPELNTEDRRVLLHPVNPDGTLGRDEVAINFDPDDEVYSTWTLFSRATTVVGANKDRGGNSSIAEGDHIGEVAHGIEDDIVRVSRRDAEDTQRTQEGSGSDNGSPHDNHRAGRGTTRIKPTIGVSDEYLSQDWLDFYQARDKYRETCAKALESRNLVLKVSWPEMSRTAEWKPIKRAQNLGKDDKFIKDHTPEVKGARDFGHYSTNHIRSFLGLQQGGSSGTRTLRLIVMNRLWPIYDLDGEQFWKAFWECVLCHYRLWVNGIHHGDISLQNLMYGVSENGDPLGIVNDFDLATCVGHSTTNNDCIGTIPFMAIDLLDGGLDLRIPRLYRHDLESFCWVLSYITVAEMEYEPRTIKVSAPPDFVTWFNDDTKIERDGHFRSKLLLKHDYGLVERVCARYFCYSKTIRQMIEYWANFHESLRGRRYKVRPIGPYELEPDRRRVPREPEADDPAGSLRLFVDEVGKCLGEDGVGFTDVKTLLLQAIETPVAVSAAQSHTLI